MTTVFFSSLEVEVLPGGERYRLTKNFYVRHRDVMYVIPSGFVTDFASVPRVLWAIFPPFGPYTKAAVLHDWLYQLGKATRAEADRAFLDAMAELDVPRIARMAMYYGVRFGGGAAWSEYQRQRDIIAAME